MPKEEYQKCFIDCIEKHFSKNNFFGFPYAKFCEFFKDTEFSIEDIYEMFCLGIDYGSNVIKIKE